LQIHHRRRRGSTSASTAKPPQNREAWKQAIGSKPISARFGHASEPKRNWNRLGLSAGVQIAVVHLPFHDSAVLSGEDAYSAEIQLRRTSECGHQHSDRATAPSSQDRKSEDSSDTGSPLLNAETESEAGPHLHAAQSSSTESNSR